MKLVEKVKNKLVKKQNIYSDSGVAETGNHVDVIVIIACRLVSLILIVLGFMAYYHTFK